MWVDISSKPYKARSKHAKATSEKPRNQGQMQKTYLFNAGQVDRNYLVDELDPLQGLLEPSLGLDEIGLHRESSPPKYVPELHLLLIPKDEPDLPRVASAGPHQVVGHPQPARRPSRRLDHR